MSNKRKVKVITGEVFDLVKIEPDTKQAVVVLNSKSGTYHIKISDGYYKELNKGG